MGKNYGINGHKQVLKNLNNVMKAVGQKYSIRVGIIGDKAYEKVPGTDLTNAQLGAIHEFGATIEVTPKMRAYLHHKGIHLKKDTTHITIPTRSFLRATLMNPKIKSLLLQSAGLADDKKGNELDVEVFLYKLAKGDTVVMETIADIIAGQAVEFIETAISEGGYPEKWAPITKYSMEHRVNANNGEPPLNDTGRLYDSITAEVKKLNG